MAAANVILNEYNSQTKGPNIMYSWDDFWLGYLLGGEGCGKDDGENCCSCIPCIIGIIGCIACFGGKFGVFLGGMWDICCGVFDCCGNGCAGSNQLEEGCCTICCI